MIGNSFTLRQKGTSVTRHNRINNVFAYYRTGRVMCAYIYVKYDSDKYVFKAPVLASYNFDPSKGRLYATYEATLNAEELGGQTIECVGFATAESQSLLVNYCEVSVQKKQGEPLLISGTLYLALSGENYSLLKGDNRLARMLLGTEIFTASSFRITYGTENTPFAAYTYEGLYPSQAIAPSFSDSGVKYSASISAGITDVVLLLDGGAVLRAMPTLAESQAAKAVTATQNDYITFAADDKVVGVSNVSINYTADTGYTVRRVPSGLRLMGDDKFRLPVGAAVKRDAGSNYFAYITAGRAAIFSLQDGALKIRAWFTASDVLLCTDGSAFIIRPDGALTLYKNGTETNFNITAGEKSAAAAKDGAFVFATWKNGKIFIYRIGSDFSYSETAISSTAIAADIHLFSMPDTVCAVARVGQAAAYTPFGENTLKKNWLNSVCDSTWFNSGVIPVYDSGRLLLYNAYFDITSYYTDMGFNLITDAGYGRYYGEFCVRNRGFSCDISLAGDPVTKLATVTGSVAHAVVKDRFLYLFLPDGRITAYYIASQSMRICSAKIIQGSTVSYTLKSVTPFNGLTELDIKPA